MELWHFIVVAYLMVGCFLSGMVAQKEGFNIAGVIGITILWVILVIIAIIQIELEKNKKPKINKDYE